VADDRGGRSGLDEGATSIELIRLARAGDRSAMNELFERNFPPLRRWAHGRLPRWVRNVAETADLVQDVMLNAFRRLDAVEIRRRGALQAYLRRAIHNRINDEFRSFGRRPHQEELDGTMSDARPSPLDVTLDAETRALYLEALARLRPADQELIVGRIELGYSYEQLATATTRPGSQAARVAVRRAILRLADQMHDARE
jgi:RNA polymerase sigma factor (sigma-70 family)